MYQFLLVPRRNCYKNSSLLELRVTFKVLPFKRLNKNSYTSEHLTSRHAHSSVVTNDSLQLIMIKFTRFTWTLTIKVKSRKFIIVRIDNYISLPYIIIHTPFVSISTTAYTNINECILNISWKTLMGKCGDWENIRTENSSNRKPKSF